jgi:serine/threonine protein kinase
VVHSKGLLHGDLRPENVMIDEHGKLKLANFGKTGFKYSVFDGGFA